MAITIDPYVAQLAQMAASQTGLDVNVILAQWNAEEGVSSTARWPGNNPAGLRPGDSADRYSNGVNAYGFLTFATPAAGAMAYAARINEDRNYAGVRAAIKTGSPLAELNAIIQSPWDAGHYGGDGHLLYESYAAITGSKYSVPSGLTFDTSTQYAIDEPQSTPQISFPATNYSVVANSQRTGNILYGRRYRILVSNSSGIALDVSDLHCTFDIQYVVNQTPPFSTVTIYNLNPETENFLLNYGDRITVEAGYEGSQYGLIFDGEVIEPIRDKEDNVTYRLTINALASNRQLNQAFANFTVARGQSARSLVENLASKASVPTPLGDISPQLSTAKLPRGKAVFGLTRDYIRQIAQANNLAFYSHDGRINLVHASDPPKGDIIDLTPQSGLIGQPAQQDLGVTFQCLLNPAITINTLVHIDNSLIQAQTFDIGQVQRPLDAQGIYRVVGVEHIGDSRGTEWYTRATTVSQAGGIPGMISATTANPWY
ncbi:MAG: hypothetical protein K6T83_01195 [Alicyclobacillus sp.]|nr:hypothetical protein [Alicyclobacillus sp.]